MAIKTKQEALSVERLINEVLINRLGIPLNNIVNDTTFLRYTGSKRPDLLISNIGYNGSNDVQFIKNLVCYAEAKDPSCTVGDRDWDDAYKQGKEKAPKLGITFFGITNCKTTYFYNVNTGEKLSLNGNLISEFQTLDVFRIIRKSLNENPLLNNIIMGPEALTSVSEAVFGKKLWELAEEYREVDFTNNIQKIDFTVGMIALEYFEEKEQIEGTKDNSKLYWSDSRILMLDQAPELVTKLITYIDWLIADDSEFNEFSPLLKKVRSLISGSRPLINAQKLYAIYKIIDSMHPLHGTGFDLFGAVYQNFANSKEKKDFGEYFTSRHYSHVLAELLLKNEDVFNNNRLIKIIDPFCGTGGMLTESFKVLKSNYQRTGMYDDDAADYLAKKCFYGIDIRSENISRTRLNMFLVGDGHTNMYQDNSLIPETKTGKKYLSQKYSYAITNPPYGSGTIQANTDVISSKRMEIAALCRIMDLLETNGRACVITPDGILENPSFMKFRDEIMRTCEIYAIISLPKFAFAPYTKEKTYALYIQKKHDRPTSNDKKKHLPTGKYQLSKIWMYIIDNDGFANSDKRFPTRLRGADQAWLHDEVQGYVDNNGIQHQSILEQRWLTFDDQSTGGTEWIDEKGKLIKRRKGGFISINTIAKDEFLTLLPEYYLRPYEPHYVTENEFFSEYEKIKHDSNGMIKDIEAAKVCEQKKEELQDPSETIFQANDIPIKDCIDYMSGNSGLTEEFIYNTIQDTQSEKCLVLSSSTEDDTTMGYVPRNAILPNGKRLKIFEGKEGLLVVRNGKAGQTQYLEKGLYTINDHAYILFIRDDCPYEINLKWLAIQYKADFLCYSSSADNGTWNMTGFFSGTKIDIPKIDTQNRIVEIYESVRKKVDALTFLSKRYQELLSKKIFETT